MVLALAEGGLPGHGFPATAVEEQPYKTACVNGRPLAGRALQAVAHRPLSAHHQNMVKSGKTPRPQQGFGWLGKVGRPAGDKAERRGFILDLQVIQRGERMANAQAIVLGR